MFYELEFSGARMQIHLGQGDQERSIPQDVDVEMVFRFDRRPEACESDRLDQTFCYHTIINRMRDLTRGKAYRLLETLTWEIYLATKETLPRGVHVWVRATKVKPPIEDFHGQFHFTVSDYDRSGSRQ